MEADQVVQNLRNTIFVYDEKESSLNVSIFREKYHFSDYVGATVYLLFDNPERGVALFVHRELDLVVLSGSQRSTCMHLIMK